MEMHLGETDKYFGCLPGYTPNENSPCSLLSSSRRCDAMGAISSFLDLPLVVQMDIALLIVSSSFLQFSVNNLNNSMKNPSIIWQICIQKQVQSHCFANELHPINILDPKIITHTISHRFLCVLECSTVNTGMTSNIPCPTFT